MRYRRFGRTGLRMPVLSCGGMRFQAEGPDRPLSEIDPAAQRNLEAVVERALELGINHIETARGYGSSERQLGRILPRLERDRILVQTKIGPNEDPSVFRMQFEESLRRLGLDHVDLLAIHGLNDRATLDRAIRPGGCFEEAQALRSEGKCRFVGFSTHGSPDLILEAIRHGAPRTGEGFDYVNLHWYFIFQRNAAAVAEAARRDMGVFIISPSDKGGQLYRAPARMVDLCRPLPPLVFNDRFCVANPSVHTLSVGAARPSDFDLHLHAVPSLSGSESDLVPVLQRLDAALRGAVEPELTDPFSLPLPEWSDTPGEVNIPVILWLRNLVRAWGLLEYARMRYNLLGQGGHWFPGRNAAEIDRIDLCPVLEGVPLADLIPSLLAETHSLLAGEARRRLQDE